jgi:hypothetical protein
MTALEFKHDSFATTNSFFLNQPPTMAQTVKDAVQAVADKIASTDAVQTLTDKVASTEIASSSTDAATGGTAPNLQLDEETGEMVSKSERALVRFPLKYAMA